MRNIELTAVFEPCSEGGFLAYIQEIDGINSQGETIEEAKENLAEAVNVMFDELRSKLPQVKTRKFITQTLSFNF